MASVTLSGALNGLKGLQARLRLPTWSGSLRVQLLVGYLLVIAIGMGGMTAWLAPRIQNDAFEEAEHELEIEAHLLALTLAPQIENFLDGRDTEVLRRLLPKIGERNDKRVTITDHELFVIFSSDPRVGSGFEDNHVEFLAAQQGKEQHDIRLDEFTGQERIFTAAAIFGESGEAIAYIQLSAPTAPVWQSVYNAWAGMGVMLVVALAVAVGLSLYLAGRVARPLTRLRDVANSLAFSTATQSSLMVQGPAEVRDLIRAFNHMTERMQRAAMRQREFVSGAAHELRSPLTALMLRLEMLAAHPPTAQELPRQMEALLAPLHRLRSAVDQLLLLASMEESNRLQPAPLDLSPLLYELAEEFAPRFAGRRFEVDVPPHLPLIRANADQMRIIFANLLDNAAKHTPPEAAIFLKANVYPDRVEVQVADEGPGIPLEEQERVFERFYRSPKARSDTPGHGLGLAIVQELVRLNGGAIELESAPGRGACFRVTLPRCEL